MIRLVVAWFATALLLASASAHADMRILSVPDNAGWQHAATKLVLMSKIAGLTRKSIGDFGQAELDIVAQYGSDDRDVIVTLYIFRPGGGNAALWFDRSQTALEQGSIFDRAADAPHSITTFVPPGQSTPSALRMSYALKSDKAATSTGLAMIPLGGWLVAIRATSNSYSAGALDQKIMDVVKAVRWPEAMVEEAPAIPVIPCNKPLVFRKARLVQGDRMMQALLGGAIENVASKEADKHRADPIRYCREGTAIPQKAIYRVDESKAAYLLAIGDAGRAISVEPAITLDNSQRYSVTFLDLDRKNIYPSFDRLPSPEQAEQLIDNGRPISSVTREPDGGTNITLQAN